ncbi:hypothetical protein [Falsiroseomonas sp. HW251]|uniref:hypothetical protein n=1 Tax=Falsiroseomonas sp. HW251 TaxID=3390998 RepID=UPI003D31F5DD
MGRAYLAWCPEAERRVVRAMIATVRRQGHSLRDLKVEPRSSNTVAVPIMQGEEVAGTIGLSFFRSAATQRALTEELVPALKQAAREIAVSMQRLRRGRG